jgi:hypothetical protein
MDYVLDKIEFDDGTSTIDVKNKFLYDSDGFSWIDNNEVMLVGNYKIYFNHNFDSGVEGGTVITFELDEEVEVSIENEQGTTVNRTYSFITTVLKFLKAIELL